MTTEKLVEKLISWIREKVSAVGCRGVVLGMSGGLDSSVLAVLCQQAFSRNTLGVIMPCHSMPEDVEHAQVLAHQFSIPTETVVLDAVFDSLLRALPVDKADPAFSRLAEANLKARLRMVTLYYLANQCQYMVAGSGNRSELATGYFTKYGDGGVDIMPLGNLLKGQIRELAQFLGVPQQIIDKPPSAGLWPGQTDEAEMGFSYAELDRYLITGEASDELRKKIEYKKAAGEHKRMLPPIAELAD